jgi:hypothetical protein
MCAPGQPSARSADPLAPSPYAFREKSGAKLSKTFRGVVEHCEDRDPVGDRERNLRLPRDQGALDRVRLVREVGTAQPIDQLEGAVVGDVQTVEKHQATSWTIGDGGSGFLAPRSPIGGGEPAPHKPVPLHASRCRNPEPPSAIVPATPCRQTPSRCLTCVDDCQIIEGAGGVAASRRVDPEPHTTSPPSGERLARTPPALRPRGVAARSAVARLLRWATVMLALPGADLLVAPTFERRLEPGVLVPDPEVTSGKPPLDEPADTRRSTPTVRVAAAHRVAGVMDPLKQGSGHVRTILPLHEPIALPPDVLVEQRGAELLEARGRVLERREDRLALVDLQAEDRVSLSSARRSRSPAGSSPTGSAISTSGCRCQRRGFRGLTSRSWGCRGAASTGCSAHYRHRAAGMQQTNGAGQRLPRLSSVVDYRDDRVRA